jgi:hypothetical protein
MRKLTRTGLVAIALLAAAVIGRASGASDGISIYVGGALAGKGVVVDGQTYVPLRLVGQALSVKVEYDAENKRIELTHWGQERQPVRPGYPLDQTQGTWRQVENGNGKVRFRDAAVTGYEFQAEVDFKSGIFIASPKPLIADFLITLYDANGQIVARRTVSVGSISSDGGSYLIEGPTVTDAVHSCSIKFITAWLTK